MTARFLRISGDLIHEIEDLLKLAVKKYSDLAQPGPPQRSQRPDYKIRSPLFPVMQTAPIVSNPIPLIKEFLGCRRFFSAPCHTTRKPKETFYDTYICQGPQAHTVRTVWFFS
jgi:hypothetical protein